jgi:hypothetical protein
MTEALNLIHAHARLQVCGILDEVTLWPRRRVSGKERLLESLIVPLKERRSHCLLRGVGQVSLWH